MPEDIPEELDFNPNPPPPTAESADSVPKKRPDIGLLSLFVGAFLAAFFTLLTTNHVEINWRLSALIYALFIFGLVWTFLVHGIPHRSKASKAIWASVIVAGLGLLATWGVKKEYDFQHTPPEQTNARILTAESDIKRSLTDLSDVLAKSPNVSPDAQLGILSDADMGLSNDEASLGEPHTVIDDSPVDVLKLQEEGNTIRARRLVEQRRQQIQKQMDDIQGKKQADAMAKQLQEMEQKQQRQTLDEERVFAEISEPIFDLAIWELNRYLQAVAKNAGQEPTFDFKGNTPSIYGSRMIKDGIFINGTNFISIGSNSEWKYTISTSVVPIGGYYPQPNESTTLVIYAQNTNGGAALVIKPDFNMNLLRHVQLGKMAKRRNRISVAVNAPILGDTNFEAGLDEYTNEIHMAVRTLVEEQIQESRLPLK